MKKYFLILLCISLLSCNKSQKIGYINIKSVFNDFEYKKELEKELNVVKNNRKFMLDSLQTNLKIMVNKINQDKSNKDLIAEYQTLREIYLDKKAMFEDEEAEMVRQSDEKIIRQLNSYVKSYGKENNYSVIYGATGNGSIMYGDSSLDLSSTIVEYINKKYYGK
jgi:outer membrane protein